MREILFKAKRIDNGEWVIGDLSHHKTGRVFIKPFHGSAMSSCEVDKSAICQYTGLTDKNGHKIFENDIVRIGGHISEVNGIYKIIFDEINHCLALERSIYYRKSYFTFSDLNGFAEDCEVISNIFDNPELLSE